MHSLLPIGATCPVHLILLDLIMEKVRSINKQRDKRKKESMGKRKKWLSN
jgi:hypothetical protein